jgi:hypothetical protein
MEGVVTIMGLKPETSYAVRLAALNGKGLGEISTASEFKTQPVRKSSQLFFLFLMPTLSLWTAGGSELTPSWFKRQLLSFRSLYSLWPT